MGRIDVANDTIIDMLVKMSEGNSGALTVLMRLMNEGGSIDKLDWAGGMSAVFELDHLDIFGSSIWILFKDFNGKDLPRMIASLRAVQLGLLNADDLRGGSFQSFDIARKVVDRLGAENFILTEA